LEANRYRITANPSSHVFPNLKGKSLASSIGKQPQRPQPSRDPTSQQFHFHVADLPSTHQIDRDVRTTKPDPSTPAHNDETQKPLTGTGIDSMLGSTVLAAEDDSSSDSQAHNPAESSTSNRLKCWILILKGLLLLFYLILWAWVLMVLYVIWKLEEGDFLFLFPNVTFFLEVLVAPMFVCWLMTGFYLRA